ISAAQSNEKLLDKLKALECHFTWGLKYSWARFSRFRYMLEDIGTEEGNGWLGHIYNLQGYIHHQLGFNDEARSFFSKAAEAFSRIRNAESDEGPWLVVNFGNKAWLHYSLGEHAETRVCLSRVDELMRAYPSPSEEELHPEICAEKAWTLMKFGPEKKLLAADYFQKAIRMQPDMVEWQTSHVLTSVSKFKYSSTGPDDDIMVEMRNAIEQDPENLFLAVLYAEQRGKKGEDVQDEIQELARKVLVNPVSSYSGINILLRAYVLQKHPDERYLKRCAALCYKWKIIFDRNNPPNQNMINRAIELHKEVISLYPDSCLVKEIDLADISAKSPRSLATADQMYQELLRRRNLQPEDKQLLYNRYGKYLNYDQHEYSNSIRYHMKAAEIMIKSFHRDNSISILQRIRDRGRNRMHREIKEFLVFWLSADHQTPK
uniref:Uncharacterized protein n=1 Tax=Echeneis naucrates TaxID=173247 RepID=A0A665W0W9_ECHNA